MNQSIILIIWQIIFAVTASQNIYEGKDVVYLGSFNSSQISKQSDQRFDENDYYVSINPTVWSSAGEDCRNIFGPYGDLIAIETIEEWEFLIVLLENYGFATRFWTSGKYDLLRNEWIWSSNNQPVFSSPPWGPGHPSTPNLILRILIYHTNRFDAYWQTVANTQLHRYICEVRKIN